MVHISCLGRKCKHMNAQYCIRHPSPGLGSPLFIVKHRVHWYANINTDRNNNNCTQRRQTEGKTRWKKRKQCKEKKRGIKQSLCVCVSTQVQLFGQMSVLMNCEEHLRHAKSLCDTCKYSHTDTHIITHLVKTTSLEKKLYTTYCRKPRIS